MLWTVAQSLHRAAAGSLTCCVLHAAALLPIEAPRQALTLRWAPSLLPSLALSSPRMRPHMVKQRSGQQHCRQGVRTPCVHLSALTALKAFSPLLPLHKSAPGPQLALALQGACQLVLLTFLLPLRNLVSDSPEPSALCIACFDSGTHNAPLHADLPKQSHVAESHIGTQPRGRPRHCMTRDHSHC